MAQIGLEPGNKIASHLSFHLSVNHSPKHPSESKLITVQVPPRTCGPTKNLYQFSKLREQYRDLYLVTANQVSKVDNALNGKIT